MTVTTLRNQVLADNALLMDTAQGFAQTVTRADLTTFDAILIDGFGEVEDPRSPQLLAQASDVTTLNQGDVLTIAGKSYDILGYQPDGFGLVLLQLGAA